jgi:hypothetical protein
MMANAPNTISHMGMSFSIGQLLMKTEPMAIIMHGMAISMNKMRLTVAVQKNIVPSFLRSRILPLVVSLAYLTLRKRLDDVGGVTR